MSEKVGSGDTPGGGNRRPSLRREIVLTLAVKAALLYVIWLVFFSEPQLPKMTEGMDPGRVAATLIRTATPPNP